MEEKAAAGEGEEESPGLFPHVQAKKKEKEGESHNGLSLPSFSSFLLCPLYQYDTSGITDLLGEKEEEEAVEGGSEGGG